MSGSDTFGPGAQLYAAMGCLFALSLGSQILLMSGLELYGHIKNDRLKQQELVRLEEQQEKAATKRNSAIYVLTYNLATKLVDKNVDGTLNDSEILELYRRANIKPFRNNGSVKLNPRADLSLQNLEKVILSYKIE